jgi:hypothetical protein
MVFGIPAMLTESCVLLDSRIFAISPHIGKPVTMLSSEHSFSVD